MTEVSNIDKRKFLRILIKLKRENTDKQKNIAEYLNISERTINSFMRGKKYDFWLLSQFSALLGYNLNFYLE